MITFPISLITDLNYMSKKLIQRFIPDPDTLKKHPQLKYLGKTLQNQNLWILNRRSAAGAVAIGLFCAWMPIPFQMLVAAIIAVIFSVNLPLSVALVWLSNPITMPPLFYGAYRLGAAVLHQPIMDFHFTLSFQWLAATIGTIAPALIVGCLILGVGCAAFGYVAVRLLWRLNIIKKWSKRKKRNRLNL